MATQSISITISKLNDGQWGGDTTDAQAALVAENLAALLEEYASRRYPEAEVESSVTDRPIARACQAFGFGDEPANEAVEGDLYAFLGDHWYEEPLWAEGFDAAAYLDELDRKRAAHAAR